MRRRHRRFHNRERTYNFSISNILFSLGIFLIGSFLLTLIISPSSFDNIKQNLESISKQSFSKTSDTVKLIPSEMEEYGSFKSLQKSCSYIDTLGRSEGISNLKKQVCTEACGFRGLNYNSLSCDVDLLTCYCSN